MSKLLWVAVPGGLSSPSTARIRVMVVPRLVEGRLNDFNLQDWPAILADTSFDLQVKTDEGGIRDADTAPVYDMAASSEAWHAFFDGDAGLVDEWSPKEQPVPQVRPTYSDARAVVTSYRECTSILAAPAPGTEAAVRQRIERWNTRCRRPSRSRSRSRRCRRTSPSTGPLRRCANIPRCCGPSG